MSEQLQLRRGTAAQVAANTPAAGEPWVATDTNRLNIGDGASAGGWAIPKMMETGELSVSAKAINANLVGDTPLIVPLPPGFTRYRIVRVTALNPSVSLTAALAAVYTAAAAGGVAACAPQALSALTNATAATTGNAIDLTLALAAPTFFGATPLYFRITTPQGAAATLDVVLLVQPYE
jgi:major tropism determinant Mtd-like protein